MVKSKLHFDLPKPYTWLIITNKENKRTICRFVKIKLLTLLMIIQMIFFIKCIKSKINSPFDKRTMLFRLEIDYV